MKESWKVINACCNHFFCLFNIFVWQFVSDMVRVDNNTGIPLEVRFTVDDEEDNFTLIHGHSGWNSIEKKPSSTLSVKYTPNITEKRIKSQNARVIVEYQDHPKTASIRTIQMDGFLFSNNLG